jgi:hypothetical protein
VLDHYLNVMYRNEKKASALESMTGLMMKLPDVELHRIAQGEKIASLLEACDDKTTWLDKFRNTEFFEQALQLEQQDLELDIQRAQQRIQNRQKEDADGNLWQAQDAVTLQKRILELELRKQEIGAEGHGSVGEMMAPAPPAVPAPSDADAPKQASIEDALVAMEAVLAKEANLGGAVMQGLKGIGSFAAKAAPQAVSAAQRGGLGGLGTNLARQATVGVGRAAQFARANPLAAGAIGAGALGAAAAGGAALS